MTISASGILSFDRPVTNDGRALALETRGLFNCNILRFIVYYHDVQCAFKFINHIFSILKSFSLSRYAPLTIYRRCVSYVSI